MRRIAWILAITLALSIFPLQVNGQIPSFSDPILDQRANELLQILIAKYPHGEVKERLRGWISSKKVPVRARPISLQVGIIIHLEGSDENLFPTLWVNPFYILRALGGEEEENNKSILNLYYQYVVLENHFNKKALLRYFPKRDDEVDIREYARGAWNARWEASWAQWVFAKKQGVAYLLEPMYSAVQQLGERRGFLEGFYHITMHALPEGRIGNRLAPLYEEIYEEKRGISTN